MNINELRNAVLVW